MRSVGLGARTTLATWCASGLLLAVSAAVDPSGFRPFTTGRWALVGVLVAFGAAATARWRVPRWATITGLGLLAALVVATVFGLDPLQAVAGHGRRHLGLAGWLVCALAFVVGHGVDATAARRQLGRAAVLAAAVTGATAVADLAGWDPLGTSFAGGRVGGLLGQPTYLAAVAVLLGPVAAGVAADRTELAWWRGIAAFSAAGCAGAVLASGTRGAWLAAAVAIAVAWQLSRTAAPGTPAAPDGAAGEGPLVFSLHRSRRRPVLAGACGVVALVLVAGPLGQRGIDTFDSSQGGGAGRLDEWRLAARVIADDPLTGVGPEGYRIAAPAHVGDGYARRHGRDEVIDRAHNGVLDVAASAGLPAAGFYVVLLGGVVVACARVLRRGPDPVLAGTAVGVGAWILQQAVSFPIAEIDPAGWLFAGVVVAAATPAPTPALRGWPLRVAAGGFAVVLAVLGVLGVMADRGLRRAEQQLDVSLAGAVDAADRATALRPDDIDGWYVAARVAASRQGILGVDAGLDRVEEGLRWSPDDPALRALEEELLVERALRSGQDDDLTAARDAAETLVADDPAGPAHHRRLGLVLAAQGHEESAKAALRRALQLDADDDAARQALASLGG